jgi:TolA-binding protein
LYGLLRAGIAQTNLADASNALSRILLWYPTGLLGEPGVLLLGQALNREGRAAEARELFSDFIIRWQQSPLVPEARLAIARTCERERNWGGAISNYLSWVANYTNHPAYPRALFSLAWAYYANGQETNAFDNFSAFLARFSTNDLDLAPKAYLWIGDYHFRHEEYVKADISYQAASKTNYPVSSVTFEARMGEGRAAYARAPAASIPTFQKLVKDQQCPLELRLEARLALGDALIASSPTNLTRAIEVLGELARSYPAHPYAARAWGQIGNCHLQLGAQDRSQYIAATNAYHRVVEATNVADIQTRSLAEYGLGQTLEKMARSTNDVAARKQLMENAVDHYLNIVNGSNLLPGETRDIALAAQAGSEAGRLLEEELGNWEMAKGVYETIREFLRPLQFATKELDGKIANARKHLQSPGN